MKLKNIGNKTLNIEMLDYVKMRIAGFLGPNGLFSARGFLRSAERAMLDTAWYKPG